MYICVVMDRIILGNPLGGGFFSFHSGVLSVVMDTAIFDSSCVSVWLSRDILSNVELRRKQGIRGHLAMATTVTIAPRMMMVLFTMLVTTMSVAITTTAYLHS